MLGEYGTIYKNYLKERLEEQLKLTTPPPKTNEFIVMVKYN